MDKFYLAYNLVGLGLGYWNSKLLVKKFVSNDYLILIVYVGGVQKRKDAGYLSETTNCTAFGENIYSENGQEKSLEINFKLGFKFLGLPWGEVTLMKI